MKRITEAEYSEHVESYDGLCLACGEWTFGDVEPDTRNRKCESCGERRVFGTEQALIMQEIEFI
jgi:hypothetical protein